jgi:serine O-acetyltransferase
MPESHDRAELAVQDDPEVSGFWALLRHEAEQAGQGEPVVEGVMRRAILDFARFDSALVSALVNRLTGGALDAETLYRVAWDAIECNPKLVAVAIRDLRASRERNPAYRDHVTAFLYYKGFQAVQWQRIYHHLWLSERKHLATLIHSRCCDVFSIDIHPGTQLGCGLFIDHGTGVVIGETAVVDDDVSILQGVTLGGTGKETGNRHPKVRRGVLIGAGAKILGNIEIGEGAKVGAGSVVLSGVAPYTTVAGVPAQLVARRDGLGDEMPAFSMDQCFPPLDYSI